MVRDLDGGTLTTAKGSGRGRGGASRRPDLSVEQILEWVDAHRRRTGSWPTTKSGPVADVPGETWIAINASLYVGRRGLPGGASLPRLLAEWRGVDMRASLRNPRRPHWKHEPRPRMSVPEILQWADMRHLVTGRWPRVSSPPKGLPLGESWAAVNSALGQGLRGLPGGMTLAAVLMEHRGVRNKQGLPPLTVEEILAWADAHHEATGEWPRIDSGPVAGAPTVGDTWAYIHDALSRGLRGLPGGSTLVRLLAEHRGVRGPLTLARILEWADAHRRATGRWPSRDSGEVVGAYGESWINVEMALIDGHRGLPGGLTIVRLLAKFRRRVPGGNQTSFGQHRPPARRPTRARGETTDPAVHHAVQHAERPC
jgi:hypothetical protein